MSAPVVEINGVMGRAALARACRVISAVTESHAPALAKASGIYPRQLQSYGEPQAMEAIRLRHPVLTLDRLIDAVYEVLPGAEAQQRVALIAHHFAAKCGGTFVPNASAANTVHEELAEKETASARASVAALRALADGKLTRGEAEEIVARCYEEMQETADLARAVVQAAAMGSAQ